MEKKCKKCRKMITYTEDDVKQSSQDYESHSELIHSSYKWIKCPHCGNVIFIGMSGWSL